MARDFPGAATNHISLGTAPTGIDAITGTAFSAHVWCMFDQVTSAYQIFGQDAVGDRKFYIGTQGSSLGIQVLVGDGGSTVDVANGTTGLRANVWYPIGLVKNGTGAGALLGYLGGVQDASQTSNVSIGDSNAICSIGSRGGASSFMDGRIANVSIWAASLTPTEMASLAQGASPLSIQPDSLRGYWPLCGIVSPEPDLKGVNPGTIVGTVPQAPHIGLDPCQSATVMNELGRGNAW